MLGGDALGVELDAVDGECAVAEAHHRGAVEPRRLAGGVDRQRIGNVLDHQRVVARGGKGAGQAGEDTRAVMLDGGGLAVHQPAACDGAAEMLPDRLMAKANSEQGQ